MRVLLTGADRRGARERRLPFGRSVAPRTIGIFGVATGLDDLSFPFAHLAPADDDRPDFVGWRGPAIRRFVPVDGHGPFRRFSFRLLDRSRNSAGLLVGSGAIKVLA